MGTDQKFKNKLIDRSRQCHSQISLNDRVVMQMMKMRSKIIKTKRFSIKPMDPEEA